MKKISINLWDDYTPPEITYMYIESPKLSHTEQKECLGFVLNHIHKNCIYPQRYLDVYFYDTEINFPKLIGTGNDLYERWELGLKNLSHEKRAVMVEMLDSTKLEFKGYLLEFYSGGYNYDS